MKKSKQNWINIVNIAKNKFNLLFLFVEPSGKYKLHIEHMKEYMYNIIVEIKISNFIFSFKFCKKILNI